MRLLATVFLVVLACPLAAAHAEPAHQDPGPGATLAAPPAVVRLDLTQPAESSGYTFRLECIGTGTIASHVNRTANGLALTLRPDAPLQNGTYVLHWAVVSAADGHPTSGAWSFVVGQASGTAAATVTDTRILWGTALAQGALFGGMALLVGTVVWRWGMPGRTLHAKAAAAGGGLVLVGGLGLLLGLASDLAGIGPALASWHGRALAAYMLLGAAGVLARGRVWAVTAVAGGAVFLPAPSATAATPSPSLRGSWPTRTPPPPAPGRAGLRCWRGVACAAMAPTSATSPVSPSPPSPSPCCRAR
jgi:copper transport protein